MELVLIGNTGSGKTTLAQRISKHFDIPHISSGRIARDLAERDASTRNALRLGQNAPESAMRMAIMTALERASLDSGGWVLEGFPRSVAQLVALKGWISTDPVYIALHTPPMMCIERVLQRARDTDTPDNVAARLQAFASETQPLLDVLGEAVYWVDGQKSADDLADETLRFLS